jgi:hypothetical protein
MQLGHVLSLANRSMKKSLLVIASVVLSLAVLRGRAPAFAQAAKNYAGKITLNKGETLSLSFALITKGEERKIEKCGVSHVTTTQNANGSRTERGMNAFGYDIDIKKDGSFSQKISDYLVAGTITADGIKGSVTMNGKKFAYLAKAGASNSGSASGVGNTGVYKSMERVGGQ